MIWEGYLDELTPLTKPTDDAYFTVSLVESAEKVTRSMFKTPAVFRMPAEELAQARTLRRGDRVTLRGKLESHSMVATLLTEGHFLIPASKTSVRTALGQTRSNLQ